MHKQTPFSGNGSDNFIIYVSRDRDDLFVHLEAKGFDCLLFTDPFFAYVHCLSDIYANKALPYAFICREDLFGQEAYTFINNLQKGEHLQAIPAILYHPDSVDSRKIKAAKKAGADDFYAGSFPVEDLLERLDFLNETKAQNIREKVETNPHPGLRLSPAKRLFDIVFSFLILLTLSPILLLIALLIKLESPGPVFYISKRVGTGYKIFNFYKFRSMRQDADKLMEQVMHQNQYRSEGGPTFIKIDKDPRVTTVGRFLRKSSLDELPQLFNVLKGDMSIVGNRPLPLYEAEQITRDLWSKRFLAPAGITGLWQVTRRGKKDMSAEERIALDMAYADECSFWFDFKIVAQTFPALWQKESV